MLGGEYPALFMRPRQHFQIPQAQHRAFFCACTSVLCRPRPGDRFSNGGLRIRHLIEASPWLGRMRHIGVRHNPARGTPSLPQRTVQATPAARRAMSSGCTHAVTEESQPPASRQAMRPITPAGTDAGATDAGVSSRDASSWTVARNNRSSEGLG